MRIALGASSANIMRVVTGEGVRVVALGIGFGVIHSVLEYLIMAVTVVVKVATGIPLGGTITVWTVGDEALKGIKYVVKTVRSPPTTRALGCPSQSLKVLKAVDASVTVNLCEESETVV